MPGRYAPSVASESTTYSYSKPAPSSEAKPKRSFRRSMRNVLSDLGRPPTARYDAENNREPVGYNNYGSYNPAPSRH